MAKLSNKNLPRDVFLYLLSIITMVVSAVSLGVLLFQYINIYFPDLISDPYFSKSNYFSAIRSALAALLVVFPVYVWAAWFLKKDIYNFPEKRELKVRKWLLYLTLFVAALVIIGDLVALIYNFLEGELSTRFMLKILSILFIAGSVFAYYFHELKEKENQWPWVKSYIWFVLSAVIVAAIAGFWVAGSPQSQRLVRFDERRVSDLQWIQGEIINYWQRKEQLPASIDSLRNDISGFIPPRDPETGSPYEYMVLDLLRFQLCAVFSTSDIDRNSKSGNERLTVPKPVAAELNYNWQHPSGRQCFEREIDPDFYPPLNKITPKI
ncbi:MAG: hypothetical protein A3B99_01015 [Candidatus Yanofskybacteria bacterium RIFCSPHIGHO2_02_FULL_44_12b]|uniref:DUF5671 domain-containing protein n=2 Tax=Candidatus Yanofskyibacteriota TaxID=1752733 RepID=A0A1F8GNB5_9BACT|nr:MAG: hypothetical protein UW79_C0002G0045 [Candidatus Yanofskybacteria bacterium GW2011_GWA2_44_9]OGN04516.1 MAG: hypothetical protein A2659_02120 [Candidatus Yanofskybacteria bacterium RIFCSPHIGHO2_01_FULL_44_24]OGN15810.1 MAG: hypothetical protein A3B99_01015 [Candidatus Yanofskybacteria bacterium RIFCSPHIGHO2_02_FULL_44_12b]OGN26136.1 MAG: hypothetical protein A2925_05035 [Candidatus Yanofskybacteria bacterium RIFCSPLOWO2_01_FULL_44_22]